MEINIDGQKKVNLNAATASVVYKHYKEYVLPIGVIIASIIIFFFVVIPEVQQYFVQKQQLDVETQKLETLKNNYNFLASLDETRTDEDLKVLSYALPSEKDAIGIINAMSIASSKTGVGIGNYEFSPGKLSKDTEGGGNTPYPSLKVSVNLAGAPNAISNFISELYKTAPVAEVTSVKTANNLTALIILFYYKPFPPQNVSDEAPVSPLSTEQQSKLSSIKEWNNISDQPLFLIPGLSSGSASLDSSPSGVNTSPF